MMNKKVEVVDSEPLLGEQQLEVPRNICKDGESTIKETGKLSSNPTRISTLKGDSLFLGDGLVHDDNLHFYDPDKLHRSEPDGNAQTTPPFQESTTPPCLRWAKDLQYLLDDQEGVNLFKSYLEAEGCVQNLLFWLACRGMKTREPTSISKVVRILYERYVKPSNVVSEETRQTIEAKLKNNVHNLNIFDVAQLEVEESMRTTTYRSFLQSDMYMQYVQEMQTGGFYSSEGSGNRSGGSNEEWSRLGQLQTVQENEVLQVDANPNPTESLSLTLHHLQLTQRKRAGYTDFRQTEAGTSSYGLQVTNPYHTMYVPCCPVSAQDSERQSLSSGAHTDTDISVSDNTEYSVMLSKKSIQRQHHHMKKSQANQNFEHPSNVIPRTANDKLDKVKHCLAEEKPAVFAAELIDQLEKARLKQEEKEERGRELAKKIGLSSAPSELTCQPKPGFWTPTMLKLNGSEDNSQSILDEHVNRVFHDELPTRPMHWKYQCASPHNPLRSGGNVSLSNSFPRNSGSGSVHKHNHQHHYTIGNGRRSNSRSMLPMDLCEASRDSGHSEMELSEQGSERRMKEQARLLTNRKANEGSYLHWDSGVSSIHEPEPSLPHGINAHERVTLWMLGNEKCSSSHHVDSEKDSSSRHRRSSHSSSMSATSPIQYRSGRGKKPPAYNASRSGSLERGPHGATCGGSHPLVQDPQKRPDTTQQLKAARKILEDDTKARHAMMQAARNKSSHFSKEKSAHMDKGRFVGKPFDGEMVDECGNNVMRKSGRKSASPAPTSAVSDGNDPIVVGYYFGGDQVPYMTRMNGRNLTLRQFKTLITKKGTFRYFFRTASDEFGCGGVVNEEISDDNQVLPLWEGKIVAQVEIVDE